MSIIAPVRSSVKLLVKRGYVETVEQEDRPDRKVHHITEAGQEELRRWLTTRLLSGEVREPWLIQVFFREVFFWMLTLECGIRATQAHLEWVESVIQRLKQGAPLS